MRQIVDLHLHSRFSLATSPRMELPEIVRAAEKKGLGLVGTGDLTHRGWMAHARHLLRPCGDGVYGLAGARFLVTGEVSVVWREEGRGRRVHFLLVAPSLAAAARIGRALGRLGKLESDGRPTLACSARAMADAVWGAARDAVIIPAHIWTPWYSILGARSGFDSLGECLGSYAERIVAVETGLSSDPGMCRRTRALDGLALVSFSDAHAPDRLGREATILDLEEVSYPAFAAALADPARQLGTVEFFPEGGKYFHDGHRACGVAASPAEARALGGRCPACGRVLTRGVLGRVEELAAREVGERVPPFYPTLTLAEIVAFILRKRPTSKAVVQTVDALVERYGPELEILLSRPTGDLVDGAPEGFAEAIAAVRAGRVEAQPGYDGVYGTVRPLV